MSLWAALFDPADRLIWNRTASAPIGLYWLKNAPYIYGQWGILSADSADAQWAQTNGFVGPAWPLLKRVSGVAGDEICRCGKDVYVNGERSAEAHLADAGGRELPVWQGCMILGESEIFLLNVHPDSLDGRYFGVTSINDMDGVAVRLFAF